MKSLPWLWSRRYRCQKAWFVFSCQSLWRRHKHPVYFTRRWPIVLRLLFVVSLQVFRNKSFRIFLPFQNFSRWFWPRIVSWVNPWRSWERSGKPGSTASYPARECRVERNLNGGQQNARINVVWERKKFKACGAAFFSALVSIANCLLFLAFSWCLILSSVEK